MRFSTLVIDPPWSYGKTGPGWWGGADRHYPVLPHSAIAQIPVDRMTRSAAHLWLWTTDTHLTDAQQLVDRWGFERKGIWVWLKLGGQLSEKAAAAEPVTVTRDGVPHRLKYGLGYYGRGVCEFLLLGVRGRNLIAESTARHERKIIVAPVGEHSAKPLAAYQLIRRYSPEDRVDVFARRRVRGFEAVGSEHTSVQIPAFERWSRWARRRFQTEDQVSTEAPTTVINDGWPIDDA